MIPTAFASIVLSSVTSLPNAQATLLPLILVALLIDGGIVTIWYVFGYVLGNAEIRQSARSEFYQLIGTALLIAIITGALVLFGGFFQTALNNTALLNQGTISSMSANIIAEASTTQTPIGILQSGGFAGVLNSAVNMQGPDPVTSRIDYPLAASGVVIENLTYQSITNINDFFIVDSYIGFLKTLAPTFGVCIASVPDSGECVLPLPEPAPAFFFSISYVPYAGLSFVYGAMASLGVLLTTALYSFIMQLSFIVVFLFIWPFLIFVGLLLRSNFFTRKLGGLFIAVAIGAVFIFPVIFAIQYLTLGNGLGNIATFGNVFSGPGSISSIYGFNALPTNSLTSLPGNGCVNTPSGAQQCGVYIPNFYVFPSVAQIAQQYGCWPPNAATQGAFGAEVADILFLWIPGVADPLVALTGALVNSYPVLSLPLLPSGDQCLPDNPINGQMYGGALGVLFAYTNMYGVYGVSGYLLPILDILITLSAVIGLSRLLGGDTELAGLGKLI